MIKFAELSDETVEIINGQNTSCFLIATNNYASEFIHKTAARFLGENCREFYLFGVNNAAWHMIFDSVDSEMNSGATCGSASLTSDIDTEQCLLEQVRDIKFMNAFMKKEKDIYIISDNLPVCSRLVNGMRGPCVCRAVC